MLLFFAEHVFEMFPKNQNLHIARISVAIMFDGAQVSRLDSYTSYVPPCECKTYHIFQAHINSRVIPIPMIWNRVPKIYVDIYPLHVPIAFQLQDGTSTQFQLHAPTGSILIDKTNAKKFGLSSL